MKDNIAVVEGKQYEVYEREVLDKKVISILILISVIIVTFITGVVITMDTLSSQEAMFVGIVTGFFVLFLVIVGIAFMFHFKTTTISVREVKEGELTELGREQNVDY